MILASLAILAVALLLLLGLLWIYHMSALCLCLALVSLCSWAQSSAFLIGHFCGLIVDYGVSLVLHLARRALPSLGLILLLDRVVLVGRNSREFDVSFRLGGLIESLPLTCSHFSLSPRQHFRLTLLKHIKSQSAGLVVGSS